jgi:hypothetical protein
MNIIVIIGLCLFSLFAGLLGLIAILDRTLFNCQARVKHSKLPHLEASDRLQDEIERLEAAIRKGGSKEELEAWTQEMDHLSKMAWHKYLGRPDSP